MIIIKWKKKIINVHEPTSQSCSFCHVVWRKGYVLIISTAPPPHDTQFSSLAWRRNGALFFMGWKTDSRLTLSVSLCLPPPPTSLSLCVCPTSQLSLSSHWRLNTEHSSTELHPSPLIYSVKADLTMALLPLSNWGKMSHCEDSKCPLLTLWLWIRW